MRTRPLLIAAILIVAVKAAVLIGDHAPLFFQLDSENYVKAAMFDLTDNARSYLYGALVRWLVVWTGSFTILVLIQTLASGLTAWLLVYALVRLLDVRPGIAIIAALVLTLEPLQLFHERLVMPETFTLLTFVCYLIAGLHYVNRPRLSLLVGSSALGIILVAFRVVYVPVALSVVLLPAFATVVTGHLRFGKWLLGHTVLVAAVTICLHAGYRQMVFAWSGYSGTYQKHDGFFLASAWAPKVSPQDAEDPRVAAVVAALPVSGPESRLELWNRDVERWADGGLIDRLVRSFDGNRVMANAAARKLAMRTLLRDPLGIARLSARTYLGFCGINWDRKGYLLDDQSLNRSFSAPFLTLVRERFGLEAGLDYQQRSTAIKRYHLASEPWYTVLALSPFALGFATLCCRRVFRPLIAFVLIQNVILLVTTCVAGTSSTVRYLHPLTFGCFLAFAVLADRAADHLSRS